MGGGYAAQLAVADPNLKAVAINYGALPTDKAALARIHAAVLGNFGGQDRGITPDDVHAFQAAMESMENHRGGPATPAPFPPPQPVPVPKLVPPLAGPHSRSPDLSKLRTPTDGIRPGSPHSKQQTPLPSDCQSTSACI